MEVTRFVVESHPKTVETIEVISKCINDTKVMVDSVINYIYQKYGVVCTITGCDFSTLDLPDRSKYQLKVSGTATELVEIVTIQVQEVCSEVVRY
jgi:hypothetical protein